MTDEKTEAGEFDTDQKTEAQAGEFDTDQRPYKLGGYYEDENYVPNPYFQYGTVSTSGTAGDDVHGNVHEVSPAFQMGRAQALVKAARALDPDDPTPDDTVVLPNSNYRSEEEARAAIQQAARHHLEHPVELGMTDARRRAGLTGEELEAETGQHRRGHSHHQFDSSAPVADVSDTDEKTAEQGGAGWTDQTENQPA